MDAWYGCEECGALVHNQETHDQWHADLGYTLHLMSKRVEDIEVRETIE